MELNKIRRDSTNLIANAAHVAPDAMLVPPVRMYGDVSVDKNSKIGKYTYIGNGCYVTNAIIGNYCSIARFIEIGARAHPQDMLSTHSFQYGKTHFKGQPGYQNKVVRSTIKGTIPKTIVGSDVWIGAKVAIKGGVKIGHGAILGSHSVITKDVPPYAVMVGSPAKVLRYRFSNEIISRLLASNWWNLEPIDMDGVDFANVEDALTKIEDRMASFRRSVLSQLSGALTNNAGPSSSGIIWLDVEKSYAAPDAIELFDVINLKGDRRKITSSWFNEETNRFGIRAEGISGKIKQGAVEFVLEATRSPTPT